MNYLEIHVFVEAKLNTYVGLQPIPNVILIGDLSRVHVLDERLVRIVPGLEMDIAS